MRTAAFTAALFALTCVNAGLQPKETGGDGRSLVAEADLAYKAGNSSKARGLYEEAASYGNADAHFELAYRFISPQKDKLFHFTEAAKKGHAEALRYALDALLFRSDNFLAADPRKALDLYHAAKRANPGLKLIDEDAVVETLERCAEPQGFDAAAFAKKYQVNVQEGSNFGYSIWALAEEASRGGRFGKPDPELVFNLVIRGSSVPAELEGAVKDTYRNWKLGSAHPFDLCDYVTSGYGEGFCALRTERAAQAARDADMGRRLAGWPREDQDAFRRLSGCAKAFFTARVEQEVDLSGSGRAAFELEERGKLESGFSKAIAALEAGNPPRSAEPDFRQADYDLNAVYRRVQRTSPGQWIRYSNGTVTQEGIQAVQRAWIPYRDAWSDFCGRRYSKQTGEILKTWLTQVRTEQLQRFVSPTP